jgi:hypothetical protein
MAQADIVIVPVTGVGDDSAGRRDNVAIECPFPAAQQAANQFMNAVLCTAGGGLKWIFRRQ